MDVKMLDFFRHMGDRDINQRERFADYQPVYSPCPGVVIFAHMAR